MRDPGSWLFAEWQHLMATGLMVGERRPVGRITVGKNKIIEHTSALPGPWRNVLFEQGPQIELGIVRGINISRAIDQDAATCTVVIYNDQMLHNAYAPQGIDQGIGRPGFRSPGRGSSSPVAGQSAFAGYTTAERDFPTSWGFPEPGDDPGGGGGGSRAYDGGSGEFAFSGSAEHNRQLLIPNRIIRTFQGYGSANFDAQGHMLSPEDPGYVHPVDDVLLVQTGVWMIDRVVFGVDGMITIECRDVAKVLLEQFVYPDMLPMDRFPLQYCPREEWTEDVTRTIAAGTPGANTVSGPGAPSGTYVSSNDPWVGSGASVHGHYVADAFDGNTSTYWLSVGNAQPSAGYSFEYITARTGGNRVNQVNVNTVGTGYRMYVSVYENGSWQGSNTIPYDPTLRPAYPNDADIPYVRRYTISSTGTNTFVLPRTYEAQFVRITFTNLWNSGIGPYPYRAAVRTFTVNHRTPERTVTDQVTFNNHDEMGVIQDWNEPVRELCGWAGLTWFANQSYFPGVQADPLLGSSGGTPLRVWGDFEYLGAGPIECTPLEFFVNKSFMECINLVANMIGALFFIDESGGAVFRMQNIFSGGNFNTGALGGGYTLNTKLTQRPFQYYMSNFWPIEFHENANLIDYQVAIDDSSVRSEVLVVGEPSEQEPELMVAGGYILGTNPITGETSAVDFDEVLAGQQRLFLVPGDDTKNFYTIEECQRMAEMTALKILFTYRKGQLRAPCHPALQIDDQIRIFERITHEYNVHYVSAIQTDMDLEAGEYVMNVTTHWLGSDPSAGPGLTAGSFDGWFINTIQLTPAVANLPAIQDRLANAQTT